MEKYVQNANIRIDKSYWMHIPSAMARNTLFYREPLSIANVMIYKDKINI